MAYFLRNVRIPHVEAFGLGKPLQKHPRPSALLTPVTIDDQTSMQLSKLPVLPDGIESKRIASGAVARALSKTQGAARSICERPVKIPVAIPRLSPLGRETHRAVPPHADL